MEGSGSHTHSHSDCSSLKEPESHKDVHSIGNSTHGLVVTHHPHVISILRQYNIPPSDIPDIAQDIWLALVEDDFRRLRSWDPEKSQFKTYFTVVVTNLVRDYLRSRQYKYHVRKVPLTAFLTDDDGDPDKVIEHLLSDSPEATEYERLRKMHEAVSGCLKDMRKQGLIDESEHLALLLRLEGCTAAEIASHLGIPVTQAESLLKRGRSECREFFERQGIKSEEDLTK